MKKKIQTPETVKIKRRAEIAFAFYMYDGHAVSLW